MKKKSFLFFLLLYSQLTFSSFRPSKADLGQQNLYSYLKRNIDSLPINALLKPGQELRILLDFYSGPKNFSLDDHKFAIKIYYTYTGIQKFLLHQEKRNLTDTVKDDSNFSYPKDFYQGELHSCLNEIFPAKNTLDMKSFVQKLLKIGCYNRYLEIYRGLNWYKYNDENRLMIPKGHTASSCQQLSLAFSTDKKGEVFITKRSIFGKISFSDRRLLKNL